MNFYKVRITAIQSTPACKVPKSYAIVELRGRKGNAEEAQHRAGQVAEQFFRSIFGRNKRLEKISYEVNPINKPASLPRTCAIIHSPRTPVNKATIWLTLDEQEPLVH